MGASLLAVSGEGQGEDPVPALISCPRSAWGSLNGEGGGRCSGQRGALCAGASIIAAGIQEEIQITG